MTRVKLDEDLPADLVEICRLHGIDAVTVQRQAWCGRADAALPAAIRKEERWLFAADKGSADIRHYPPGAHHGIVCFRAAQLSRGAYVHLAMQLLTSVGLEQRRGSLVVVSSRGIRTVNPGRGDAAGPANGN